LKQILVINIFLRFNYCFMKSRYSFNKYDRVNSGYPVSRNLYSPIIKITDMSEVDIVLTYEVSVE